MSEPAHVKSPAVVVVDDDPELLNLMGMLLRRIGADAATFLDGAEALEHLKTTVPDLVILDLMLPDMDGLEILTRLRAEDKFDQMPVLILSAKADPNTIRYGLSLGADGYITKPYIASSLIDRVRLLLSVGRGAQHDRSKPSP